MKKSTRFECDISKEDIVQENVSHLIIDDDDDIMDVEAWHLGSFFILQIAKKLVYHGEFSHVFNKLSSPLSYKLPSLL